MYRYLYTTANTYKMVNNSIIIEYINKQANDLIKYDLVYFFKFIHNTYFQDIDISFMEYFLELCNKRDEFCINHNDLVRFEVFKSNNLSANVKERIVNLELIENEHYSLLLNVQEQSKTSRGVKYTNIYMFKPDAFKIILMRSKNTYKYAKYYLLLENIFYLYQEYQKLYQVKLLSIKDDKIDHLLNQNKTLHEKIDEQSKNIKDQSNNIEKLMKYAKDTNEIVHELNIKIDELLKLVHQFLSNQINLLYTFNSNIDQTKVLIIYKLQNLNDIYSENKFRIVIRYSGLNMISNSISQFMKKKINKKYVITKTIIIGAIQENMITIQSIYKNLDNIDNLNKQTINDISDEESEQLIEEIFKIVNKNKLKLFVDKLEDTNNKSNEILKNHCDTMKHLTMMDNEFNNNINNTIKKYLSEKIINKKSFQVKKLCTELKNIYNKYKE